MWENLLVGVSLWHLVTVRYDLFQRKGDLSDRKNLRYEHLTKVHRIKLVTRKLCCVFRIYILRLLVPIAFDIYKNQICGLFFRHVKNPWLRLICKWIKIYLKRLFDTLDWLSPDEGCEGWGQGSEGVSEKEQSWNQKRQKTQWTGTQLFVGGSIASSAWKELYWLWKEVINISYIPLLDRLKLLFCMFSVPRSRDRLQDSGEKSFRRFLSETWYWTFLNILILVLPISLQELPLLAFCGVPFIQNISAANSGSWNWASY